MAWMVEAISSLHSWRDLARAMIIPGGLILAGAVGFCWLVEYLKKGRSEDKKPLVILQVLIVIGAIVVIGWKIYNELTPSPQEPVKRRMVLLPGEGEMSQPSGKTSPK
ncbi:TPA: hypothetical protein QHB43_002594 [Aeromonas hydrophila subsp. hydrophila]|nr:hypothetical protein [Aeromonas hydrophila subsp. hydrophila]